MYRSLLTLLGCLALTGITHATTSGTDNADQSAYSGGWSDGIGATGGFSNWSLVLSNTGSGFAGWFIGDSTNLSGGNSGANINTNSKAFGMYGNQGSVEADSYRTFDSGLAIGQTFSVDVAVNYRNGNKGIDVRDASTGATIFNLNVGGDDYVVNNATTGNGSLGNSYDSNTAFNVALTQTSSTGGTWLITRSGGVVSSGSGSYTGLASGFKLYVGSTDDGSAENNFYSNNLSISGANTSNTWTGSGGANWSNDSNWGGAQPTAVGTLTFSGSAQTTNSVDQNYTANKLFFSGGSSWSVNQSGSSAVTMVNYNGTQAKIENQSTGAVAIGAPVTFAQDVNNSANFGEINAVNGDLTFNGGALTVSGSAVNGVKLWGSGHNTTFNDTVNASGKYFALTGGGTMTVGGALTSGQLFVMNGGTLSVTGTGSITIGNPFSDGVRLGGDFGTTGNQDQSQGGTFALASSTGGQTFNGIINTVGGNTSDALAVASLNTSGTNALGGPFYLDGNLKIQKSAGGELQINASTFDVKSATLTFDAAGDVVVNSNLGSSTSGGVVTKTGVGAVTLNGSNSYVGATNVNNGTLNFGVSETLLGGLTVASSGTAAIIAHTGGASNVKVLDLSALSITTSFDVASQNQAGFATASPVPEPATTGLIAAGALAFALLRRRRS